MLSTIIRFINMLSVSVPKLPSKWKTTQHNASQVIILHNVQFMLNHRIYKKSWLCWIRPLNPPTAEFSCIKKSFDAVIQIAVFNLAHRSGGDFVYSKRSVNKVMKTRHIASWLKNYSLFSVFPQPWMHKLKTIHITSLGILKKPNSPGNAAKLLFHKPHQCP